MVVEEIRNLRFRSIYQFIRVAMAIASHMLQYSSRTRDVHVYHSGSSYLL